MIMLVCLGGFLGYTLAYAGIYNHGQYAQAPWNALRGTQSGSGGGASGSGGGESTWSSIGRYARSWLEPSWNIPDIPGVLPHGLALPRP